MKITDNLYSLYIKNILIPQMEDFSNPGYIFTKLTRDSKEIMLRDIFIPEDLIAEIEVKTIERYGEEGRKLLYTIGKNSGYIYAKFSGFENIKTKPERKDFEEYLRLLLLFVAGTYGANVTYEFDILSKLLRVSFSRYVTCQENGIGEIFMSGSAAGLWAWMLQDTTIEGVQYSCVGRGGPDCSVLLAPIDILTKEKYRISPVTNLIDLELTEEYLSLNKPHVTESTKSSLDKLIEYGVLTFKEGRITFHNRRYFECDTHYLYFLEYLHNDQEMLFELTKNYYKKVGEEVGDKISIDYISEFLGGMGWGDVIIYDGPKIQIKHYPYTTLYDKSSYSILRGALSGLLSTLYKEDITLNRSESILDQNAFSIILSK